MSSKCIPDNFAVLILKTYQVIATGLTTFQAKQRCREWNGKASVETWAAWTTAWHDSVQVKAVRSSHCPTRNGWTTNGNR